HSDLHTSPTRRSSDLIAIQDKGKLTKILEVLTVSTKLGLTSFGGPIAHLGYFHNEYVRKRKWMDERAYADLVALCQFLPGPASRDRKSTRLNSSHVKI